MSITTWYERAAERLNQEYGRVTGGNRESAMKSAVQDALLNFCRQNGEFARAVVQGRSFPECMKAVANGVGSSISDLEAYRRAVEFYFPGAEIQMTMTIDLCGRVRDSDADNGVSVCADSGVGSRSVPPKPATLSLKLSDFL